MRELLVGHLMGNSGQEDSGTSIYYPLKRNKIKAGKDPRDHLAELPHFTVTETEAGEG